MPQVKTSKIYVGGVMFVRKVRCNAAGVFHISLPADVAEFVGFAEVTGSSLREAETAFDAVIVRFTEARTETRRVILYEFKATCRVVEPDEELLAKFGSGEEEPLGYPDGAYCVRFARDDISFCDGTALALQCGVYVETVVTARDGSKRYRYKPEVSKYIPPGLCRLQSGSRTGPYNSPLVNRLDWTEQRELFFAKLGLALEALICRLDQLTSDPGKLIELADKGASLPELGRAAAGGSSEPRQTTKRKRN